MLRAAQRVSERLLRLVLQGLEMLEAKIKEHTVDGCEILHHLGWLKPQKIMG
jgi:hypothetical protein